jgi:enamine deaminase RidA (YjgF/YER057c/UK114 family)
MLLKRRFETRAPALGTVGLGSDEVRSDCPPQWLPSIVGHCAHREQAKGGRPVSTRFINPPTLSKPPGYTHVVEATAPARIVYIAGQLGVGLDGNVVGDFRAQAVQTFENLKAALATVGGGFEHVVKLNNYLTDINDLPTFREVRDRYLPKDNKPASTTLSISKLARAGASLEVEAVAVLPAAKSKSASKGKPARRTTKAARSKRR